MEKERIRTVVLEPCYRSIQEVSIDLNDKRSLDMMLSEAPSMTACGELAIDRTFIPVPDTEDLFIVYNKHQEEWHRQRNKEDKESSFGIDESPVVIITEMNLEIYSRCMIVRKDTSDKLENLRDGDIRKVKNYLTLE